MSDLVRNNPRADVVYICDKPLDVPDDENLWALQLSTGRIVTSAEPLELRLFADIADVFFEYDPDAPLSSLEWAPREWGLTCKKPVTFLSDSESLLPRQKRCEGKLVPSPLFAQTAQGKTPCDPSVQEQKRADPVRVRVCVRPPGVGPKVSQWAAIKGVKGARFTESEAEYAKEVANAQIIFIFDEHAPAESVYYFDKDAKKLRCPGKPPPKPLQEILGSGSMPLLGEMVAKGAKTAKGDPKKGSSVCTSQTRAHARENAMIEVDKDVNIDETSAVEWFRQLGQFLTQHPEPKSYTNRQVDITHETLESASIHDILQPVFQADCACKTLEEWDQNLAQVSAAQRRLYAVWWYEAEVGNGGHQQFYCNSYGMFWQDAIDGLEAIGAHSARQILLDSVVRFAQPPSRDRARRNHQVEGLDFHDLDIRLYANAEDLDALMRKFILTHAGDFLFSGILRYENPSEFKCVYGKNGFRWERLTT